MVLSSRQQRREVAKKLQSLSAYDFSAASSEQTRTLFEETFSLMILSGVSKQSSHWQTLGKNYSRALALHPDIKPITFLEQNLEDLVSSGRNEPLLTSDFRQYAGACQDSRGNHYIVVVSGERSSFSLYRVYTRGRIKADWGFKSDGRLIEFSINNQIVLERNASGEDFSFYYLPDSVKDMNRLMRINDVSSRVYWLIAYGVFNVENLRLGIKKRNLKDPDRIFPNQRKLPDIIQDEELVFMLRQVNEKPPGVKFLDEKRVVLDY